VNRSRWLVRGLVIGTALLCLGVAGYAGQVWQAKRIASEWRSSQYYRTNPREALKSHILWWPKTPFYGEWGDLWETLHGLHHFWMPRRTHYEILKLLAEEDLGNDPSAWEVYLKDHPDLVWDDQLKRLVDGKPKLGKP